MKNEFNNIEEICRFFHGRILTCASCKNPHDCLNRGVENVKKMLKLQVLKSEKYVSEDDVRGSQKLVDRLRGSVLPEDLPKLDLVDAFCSLIVKIINGEKN